MKLEEKLGCNAKKTEWHERKLETKDHTHIYFMLEYVNAVTYRSSAQQVTILHFFFLLSFGRETGIEEK